MLDFGDLNYWAIVIAWLVNCAVGAFWYSPAGFAKHWKRYTGIDIMKIPPHEANRILVSVVVSGLVQAFTLAVILNSLHVSEGVEGLKVALFLWLGLVTATTVGVTLYQQRSWKFLWLNSAYFLVVMAVNSLVLTAW